MNLPALRQLSHRKFLTLLIFTTVMYLTNTTMGSFYYAWQLEFGVGTKALSFLSAIMIITLAVFSLVWASSIGRRSLMSMLSLGFIVVSISSLWIGISETFTEILVSGILFSIGFSSLVIAIFFLIMEFFPKEVLGKQFGLYTAAIDSAYLIGPLFGTLIGPLEIFHVSGWRIAYYLLFFVQLVIFFLLRTTPIAAEISAEEAYDASRLHTSLNPFIKSPESKSTFFQSLSKTLSHVDAQAVFLLLGEFFKVFTFSLLYFLPLFLRLGGYDASMISFFLFTLGISGIIGIVLGGYLSDFASRRRHIEGRIRVIQTSLFLGAFFIGSSLWLGTKFQTTPLMIGIAFMMIGVVSKWVITFPLVAYFSKKDNQIKWISVMYIFQSMGIAVGIMCIGWIAQGVFGYAVIDDKGILPEGIQKNNYDAISYSMLITCLISTGAAILCYGGVLRHHRQAK